MGLGEKYPPIMDKIPGSDFWITNMDKLINWSRKNSLWPLTFGTSCCAIEMLMATGGPRHDIARFGSEAARPSPRQADLLILAGTIVKRMAPRLRNLYEQMAEPRYVISTGACTISGGPFNYYSYHTIRRVDEIIPVDVYVPGCPPRPEGFFYGLMILQKMIKEGVTVRDPNVRRKPVLAELPPGVTMKDIQAEMSTLLKKENTVNVRDAFGKMKIPTGLQGRVTGDR